MNRLVLLAFALMALALTAASSAEAAPRLQIGDAGASKFPERGFLLTLPERRALDPAEVSVTEDGGPVSDLRLVTGNGQGAGGFALVLAIDASNSMAGEPIEDAMAAARAFAERRGSNQPLGVVFFSREPLVALEPTTDAAKIDSVLGTPPALSPGTRMYDAAAAAVGQVAGAKVAAGTVLVLSDGADRGSRTRVKELAVAARNARARIFTVGLQSGSFDPRELSELAAAGRGEFAEAGSAARLREIFAGLGERFGNEYLVTYRSTSPLGSEVTVRVEVDGIAGAATGTYRTPEATRSGPGRPAAAEGAWSSPGAAAIVGVLVVALIAFAVLMLLRPRRASVRERIQDFVAPSQAPVLQALSRQPTVLAGAERSLARLRGWEAFEEDLEIARVEMTAVQIALLTLCGTVGSAWFWAVVADRPVVAVLTLAVPLIVRSVVRAKADRQRRAFADQLPENLQSLGSAMRAGHSLVGALTVTADAAAEPSRTELRHVLADEQLGVPVEVAFESAARRMRSEDVGYVGLIAQLQRESGGNTAEVLDRVVETIQERAQLRRVVRALTAQGRLGGTVVSALPFGVLGIISVLNPEYLEPLVTTTLGKLMIATGLVLIALGWTTIRRIVDIQV